ncbi:MAG: thioredoxin family protein [Phycisphaeraceae bacterium]|nr:thioredoxin family protein [Phycisphaeraceae bacterium]
MSLRFFVLLALSAATLLAAIASPAAGQFQPDPFQPGAASAPGAEPAVLTLDVIAARSEVRPGDQVALAVRFTMAAGYHTWPSKPVSTQALPGWSSIPSTIRVKGEDAAKVVIGPVQWPDAELVETSALGTVRPVEIRMYEGSHVAFVPLIVADDAPIGQLDLTIEMAFQSCDDMMCLPPDTVSKRVALSIAGRAAADSSTQTTAGSRGDESLFGAFDASVFARMLSGEATEQESTTSSRPTFFGIAVPEPSSVIGTLLVAIAAAVGGLVLNLTPCVLPVIPIKVMTISRHGGSPGRSLMLGLWMAAGVVAFWVGIGLPVAFWREFGDPSQIFGYWWFTLGIGLLIGAMGVGIMGLFTIQLPQAVYKVNPKADSAHGSFLFGVMTAVLGLPCFGFVAGALLAGSARLPSVVILTIFASLGVGMALPYLVLAAKPGLVERLPKTGPASELVKQVMGLFMLAAAAFFVGSGVIVLVLDRTGPAPGLPWWWKQVHWWVVALLCVSAGAWLIWRTFQLTSNAGRRAVFSALGGLVAAGSVWFSAHSTLEARKNFWIPFTEETLRQALAEGKTVVLDFTAEWCLNCKTLEATVLSVDPVRSLLLSPEVVPLKADNTSASAPGWEKLKELGGTGIPQLYVFGPGADRPWGATAYTSDQVVDAIERARSGAE